MSLHLDNNKELRVSSGDPRRDNEDRQLLNAVYTYGASKELKELDLLNLSGKIDGELIDTLRNPDVKKEIKLLKSELKNYFQKSDNDQNADKKLLLGKIKTHIEEIFHK